MDESRSADKMVVAIVQNAHANGVQTALLEQKFRVTRINSSGGFLRRGNVTFLVGVPADREEAAVEIIRAHAGGAGAPERPGDPPVSTMLFVLPIARFARI